MHVDDEVLISAEQLKPFTVRATYLAEFDPGVTMLYVAHAEPESAKGYHPGRLRVVEFAIHASDADDAADWASRAGLQHNGYGVLRGTQIIPGHDVAEPDAIANAKQLVASVESAIAAERARHQQAMADLARRQEAAQLQLADAHRRLGKPARRAFLDSQRPGTSERLNQIRSRLNAAINQRLMEERRVATRELETRIGRRQAEIQSLQARIDECNRLLLVQTTPNAGRISANRQEFFECLAIERRKLAEAESENAARKLLEWHREREAELVAEYNAIVSGEREAAEQEQRVPELAGV